MFDDTEDFDGIEEFGDAKNGFVSKDELLGRLLLIKPSKRGTRKGEYDDYVWVETDVHIIAGEPDEMFFPEVPAVLERFQFTGQNIVPALEAKLPKAGNNWKAGWLLGRMEKKKSQSKKRQDSYVWSEITDEDKAIAREYAEKVKAQARARAAQSEDETFA